MGGTLNCGSGSLEVRTTALAADSAVARMAALVEEVSPPLFSLPFNTPYQILYVRIEHLEDGNRRRRRR
jgi:hypothetical protein